MVKHLSEALDLRMKKLCAVILGSALAGSSTVAQAQGIAGIANSITEQTRNLPDVITTVAYLGGAVLSFGGVLSVKQHVDSPQQKPLREGLVRLVVGALLLAAPATFEALRDTTGLTGTSGLTNQKFHKIEF